MKLYIVGPGDNEDGNGLYGLVSEEGEGLASHLCSNRGFARGDLEGRRPERQKEWKEKFGEYEVLNLGDDDMTRERLVELNEQFHSKEASKIEKK